MPTLTDDSLPPTTDSLHWHASLRIDRWDAAATEAAHAAGIAEPGPADFERLGLQPYASTTVDSNLLTTAGLSRITSLLTAGGGQAITSTSARVGVGDGAGTAAVGDTDLSAAAGSTHRWFQTCTITASGGTITAVAAFGSADGNFAWNEWGLDVGAPTVTSGNTVNAVLVNHKTSISQGTKAVGQTWTATATITLS